MILQWKRFARQAKRWRANLDTIFINSANGSENPNDAIPNVTNHLNILSEQNLLTNLDPEQNRSLEDSDIDIAVILDNIKDRFEEYEKISQLGSDISLEYETLVSFLLVSEADYQTGRFAVHRKIKEEGIAA